MGLDMRLSRKTYVKNWTHQKPEDQHVITIKGNKASLIDVTKISYIEEELMYWRKANAIHNFFTTDEYINGTDIYISTETLKDLHERCLRISKECPLIDGIVNNGYSLVKNSLGQFDRVYDKTIGKVMTNIELAEELLPSTDGFFFGSTDYDQYYMHDINNTLAFLDNLMAKENWKDGDYYYNADW